MQHNAGGNDDGALVFYGASRSKKINYDGNLRQYLAERGLGALQVRDRDASPEDVMRTLAKRRKRYSLRGESIVLSLMQAPSQHTLMAYDIARVVKRRGVEVGAQAVGQVTLALSSGRLFVESSDAALASLPDAETISQFCADLYTDFVNAPRTINPSSAAWMARKVLEHLGGTALKVNDRSGTAWWLPAAGVEKAREYCEGLGWEFLALPVVMNEDLAAAIEASRTKAAA